MSEPVFALVTGLIVVALLGVVASLLPRRSTMSEEDRAWRQMFLAVTTIAGFAVLAQGIDLLTGIGPGGPNGAGNLVFTIGGLLACAPIYQGMIHWNRTSIQRTDPGESLNGISAFLVAVGLADLFVPLLPAAPPGLPEWQFQASVLACAAAVIVLGTAASIMAIGGIYRDPRIWIVIGAIVALGGGELTALLVGDAARPTERTAWLLGAALITVASLLRTRPSRPQLANHQATVIGAMVVLIAGVAILALNNTVVQSESHLATFFAAAGVLGVSLRVLRLIQDLAQFAQTRHEAMTDELTGVANRRALLSAIDESLLIARSTSLLIIDLDRFKAINDRYGHAAGDLLLQHVARAFVSRVPATGMLARLGGDEFAVLLRDAEQGEATRLARRLADAATPLNDRGQLLEVGVSVGVATIESPGVATGELLRRADAAMYQAKTSHSDVREYDSELDAAAQERVGLVEDLHIALAGRAPQDEQMVVFFQPQLKTATGAVVGAEALVRWAHPRLGLLAPDRFIELIEQNGLMPNLTARVIREATAQAACWRTAGHQLRVSVNLSATCLSDETLLPLIDEVLDRGLAPGDLVLEVTETSLMTDPEQALSAMKRLAERGVGVSIDDYGTGYSSLSYLNDLPATELKIDRSFTARTVSDARTAAIVAGTVELAHRLGIRLVAEGVEDEATLLAMTDLGCDETQGYLHSRPLPAAVFLEWLDSRSTPPANTPVANTPVADQVPAQLIVQPDGRPGGRRPAGGRDSTQVVAG